MLNLDAIKRRAVSPSTVFPGCVVTLAEDFAALCGEVKQLQAENESREDTVNAMLGPLSAKRRGKPHSSIEAVQNTVCSYEGEIAELKAADARLQVAMLGLQNEARHAVDAMRTVARQSGSINEVLPNPILPMYADRLSRALEAADAARGE